MFYISFIWISNAPQTVNFSYLIILTHEFRLTSVVDWGLYEFIENVYSTNKTKSGICDTLHKTIDITRYYQIMFVVCCPVKYAYYEFKIFRSCRWFDRRICWGGRVTHFKNLKQNLGSSFYNFTTDLQHEYEYDLREINTTEFVLSSAHQRKGLIERYDYNIIAKMCSNPNNHQWSSSELFITSDIPFPLFRCTWNGEDCDLSKDLSTTYTDLGVCYTFNGKQPSLSTHSPGEKL